ncbi:unnamed protein product [Paramecium primaurelia]|uniref:Uncharacterized protein n=1 Tax=Paramecium primaurelia TaxID=5886 RepID=A0A8S1L4X7_PARPR|nr:unnamed protein product [Paramecium primaurelia]
MRQQIYQPTYGVGFTTQFQQISQPSIKIVSQPSFQTQIQLKIQQPFQHQQQTSFSQQQNRPIIPINGTGSVCRPAWDQPKRQRFHTSQSNISPQNQMHLLDLQQIEEPWKIKVQELQKKISILEEQQLKQQEDQDVETDLSQAYSQIQQLVNTIKILQEEIQQLEEKVEIKQSIIDGYDKQLVQKDIEIEKANQYISELHNQLEHQTIHQEEKQKYLFEEVNTWKRKFIEQNNIYQIKNMDNRDIQIFKFYSIFSLN